MVVSLRAQAAGPGTGSTIPDVAEQVVNSVVNISATVAMPARQGPAFHDPFLEFFGHPRQRQRQPAQRDRSLGSGVIVSADGLVLTNNHVVQHAREITVTLVDGREMGADVVGADPKTDLALIRVKGSVKGLRPVSLGDSDRLRLGETVLAIGNPFGLGHTVTMGIVSAKGRAQMGIADYEDFIQTDAAINPGNSGGALVDTRGQLVGINTAIASRSGGYQGIGFAIPSKMARQIMDALLADGRVRRGWLGIGIQDLDASLAEGLGLASTTGVLVSDVASGSPADRGGLKRGDVVLELDGATTSSAAVLRNTVAHAGPGKRVKLEVRRQGAKRSLEVELGEIPSDQRVTGRQPRGDTEGVDGLRFGKLEPRARKRFDIPRGVSGALVTQVDPGSAAARSGLRPGDVVVEINHRRVRSVSDAARRVKASKALLLVHRGGRTLYLVLRG